MQQPTQQQPEPLTLVLVGIGGYGLAYLSSLLEGPSEATGADPGLKSLYYRVAGAVDPMPDRCGRLSALRDMRVPLFATLEDFYRSHAADLAVISSPIHRHCEQTCLALSKGSHVLCEKPAAATVQEVDRMIQARNEAGKQVAVGFQWSFSRPIQAIKRDILAGRFGRPLRMKSLCLWPRDHAYYTRNRWAARMRDDQGAWILDSPMNNAMAHFLHNMLYLLGPETNRSANPAALCSEHYRANDIETFDTAALRVMTDQGVEILFYVSHGIPENEGPIFRFEFTDAVVEYPGGEKPVTARLKDGTVVEYAYPDSDFHTRKLWACLEAVANGTDIPCGLEASRPQIVCVNGAHESVPEAAVFPDARVSTSGTSENPLRWVEGLDETLRRCYRENSLPSEQGDVPWARGGSPVDLAAYLQFPSKR